MKDLPVLVVSPDQHHGAWGAYLVAGYPRQLASSVVHLVFAARVSLPGESVHARAAYAERPQGEGGEEGNMAWQERGDHQRSEGREDSRFVEEVSHFDPPDAVVSQARGLHDHHSVALLQGIFELALQGGLAGFPFHFVF